jgi:peptidoglycan/xylan/chitin deacetylase (PgdA/CDA1 family)
MRAIVTYHSIDSSRSPISIAPETFDRHVRWLASGRIRVLSLADLLTSPPDSGDAIALTFDDAFANFGTLAWPRLEAHGLPVTVFVVTDHVGRVNDWGGRDEPGIPRLPLMGWDDLARCRDGGAEIGAHTRTHPSLPTLSPVQAEDEMVGSRDDLRHRLGVTPTAFAYPYGHLADHVVATARTTFRLSCTTDYRLADAIGDLALLPRLDAFYFQRPGAFERWGTPAFRARVAARRTLRGLRAAAQRLGPAR